MKAKLLATVTSLGLMGALVAAPISSYADGWHHERQQRNEWNGLALGSAVLGLIGVASNNDGLAVAGGLGALYSGYRAASISRDRDWDDRDRGWDNRDRGWNDRRFSDRQDRRW